jgi:hypothetical protein
LTKIKKVYLSFSGSLCVTPNFCNDKILPS